MENMSNLIDEWKSVSDAEKKSWLKLSSKTNCYVERAWSQVDRVAQKDKDIDRIKGEILLTTCIICHRWILEIIIYPELPHPTNASKRVQPLGNDESLVLTCLLMSIQSHHLESFKLF